MEIIEQYHKVLTPLDPVDIYCAIESAGPLLRELKEKLLVLFDDIKEYE